MRCGLVGVAKATRSRRLSLSVSRRISRALAGVETGRLIPIPEQKVKTPGGDYTTNRRFFDRTGIYEYESLVVAANLLDPKESDLTRKDLFESESGEVLQAQDIETEEDKDLTIYLIMAVLAILFTEIIILKLGGDL